MDRIQGAIEDLPSRKFNAIAAFLALAPLSPIPWTAPSVDLGLAGLALAGAIFGVVGSAHRRRIAALPLQVGAVASAEPVAGGRLVRVCVWLGRGRPLRRLRAVARWEGAEDLQLVWAPPEGAVGPAVLLFRDPGAEGAALDVEVSVEEQGERRVARARFAREALRTGRFASPLGQDGAGWRWARERWGALVG